MTLDHEKDTVHNARVQYFDTIPPAAALCVSRQGFLFAAAECGDHHLFTFQSTGAPDAPAADQTSADVVYFLPAPLRALALADTLPALGPLTAARVLNPAQEAAPQIYALSGRGADAALAVLRYGLEVAEVAVSDVPGSPSAVWSLKKRVGGANSLFYLFTCLWVVALLCVDSAVSVNFGEFFLKISRFVKFYIF